VKYVDEDKKNKKSSLDFSAILFILLVGRNKRKINKGESIFG
jgi:hypothetical protein